MVSIIIFEERKIGRSRSWSLNEPVSELLLESAVEELSETLKKTMLKTEASSVAGRKIAPRNEMVFIEVLSRLLAWARRRWSAAIWRLSLDSFWAMMLYSCVHTH